MVYTLVFSNPAEYAGMAVKFFEDFRLDVVAGENGKDIEEPADDSPAVPHVCSLEEMINLLKQLLESKKQTNALVQRRLVDKGTIQCHGPIIFPSSPNFRLAKL